MNKKKIRADILSCKTSKSNIMTVGELLQKQKRGNKK